MKTKINILKKSKNEDDRRACIALLANYLGNHKDDAEAWYDKACCHDYLGEEMEAEPCYEWAYKIGWRDLPQEEQFSLFLGYGSTLRNNLKFEKSVEILREGISAFPDAPVLKVFLALSFYSLHKDREAVQTLFASLFPLQQVGYSGYEKPIRWYIENLDQHPVSRN